MRICHAIALLFLVSAAAAAPAQVSVLTHHVDNSRTGANLAETQLTPANVTNATFGKLAYRVVDGDIYAQPLIVAGVNTGSGGTKNLAIVATENNSVYAFDAENNSQAANAQVWYQHLDAALDYQSLYSAIGAPGCTDMTLQIGISGTPAVMLNNGGASSGGAVFTVVKTKVGSAYVFKLYGLDLATGTTLGSVAIAGSASGTGIGSTGTGAKAKIVFQPMYQHNRPALALVGKTLYLAFGGHCDAGPYHGWVFAYDVSNPAAPKQLAVWCVTRNGNGPAQNNVYKEGLGGIWMSGEGPAVDETGNVYFVTANGTYNGTTDFADSVVKLQLAGNQLQVQDWFTPQNQVELKSDDYDLGSGGIALIPNSHLAITGGKEGRLYLLDRNNLGKGTADSLQSFQVTTPPIPIRELGYNIHGTPILWARPTEVYIYLMGEEDHLKQFRLTPDPGGAGWKFDPAAPYKVSLESAPYPDYPAGDFTPDRQKSIWMPGGFMTLSANGTTDGSGIVWVNMPFNDNANRQVVRGILRAFNANDVSAGEIWDSESTGRQNDSLGQFAKFCPPVVANGKVYVSTFQQEAVATTGNYQHTKAVGGDQPALVIYGLLKPAGGVTP